MRRRGTSRCSTRSASASARSSSVGEGPVIPRWNVTESGLALHAGSARSRQDDAAGAGPAARQPIVSLVVGAAAVAAVRTVVVALIILALVAPLGVGSVVFALVVLTVVVAVVIARFRLVLALVVLALVVAVVVP